MATATAGNSRYIALTTYRRDGRPVTTPVWAVSLEGKVYVVTAKSTGKARRLGVTGRVRFAPCSMNGRWQLSLAMLVYRWRGFDRERVVLELTPSPAT
jgi:PPOX class probable F420-dependent enzyme